MAPIGPGDVPLSVLADPTRSKSSKADEVAPQTTHPPSPLKQLKVDEKKRSPQEERPCVIIKLSRCSDSLRLMTLSGPDFSLGFGPLEFECSEAGVKPMITSVHLEPPQL